MAKHITIKLTENFERNLKEIEAFLTEANAAVAYHHLLDILSDSLIPNLEHFPTIGRPS